MPLILGQFGSLLTCRMERGNDQPDLADLDQFYIED